MDEYQAANVAQYLWLRLLAQHHKNICCVGDDDQSIYGWRGAEVGNILRFEEDFPGAKVIRLERNYRSTPHILAAASGLIAHNEGRFGKTLWTDNNEGDKVIVRGVWDGEAEARFIGEEVEALHRKRQRPYALPKLEPYAYPLASKSCENRGVARRNRFCYVHPSSYRSCRLEHHVGGREVDAHL